MIYNENGKRFESYYKWENVKHLPYNYKRDGLLKHIMSRRIVESNNYILQCVLHYVEQSMIFLMKYTDCLKHFKDFHWKNR